METLSTTVESLDLKEANDNLAKFLELQTQKAAIDASMKAYKEKLKEFADKNAKLVNKDGNLILTTGYLHYGTKTTVKHPVRFNVVEFIKKFPALIDWKFKVSPVKAFFDNVKTKEKLRGFGLKLVEDKTFDIVAAKAENIQKGGAE